MPFPARGRRQEDGPSTRDPLTTLMILLVYPIFSLLFIILHASYYLSLKVIASIRWQRYVYLQASQRPLQLVRTWRSGVGLGKVGWFAAQKASEERLLKRGNVVRSNGRMVVVMEKYGGKVQKGRMLAPRHLALVLASRPIRLRTLLFRACLSVFPRRRCSQGPHSFRQRDAQEEKEQLAFALESVETALRCCSLAGVEEISIYDEAGRVKGELLGRGKPEWNLEWPLDQEWEALPEEETPGNGYETPRSESFSSISPSFSSALDSTPALSSRPSSVSLSNGVESEPPSASSTPRLCLSASLHSPFSEEPESTRRKRGNVFQMDTFSSFDAHHYHAKIKLNLLGPTDGKAALARAASIMAAWDEKPKVIEVKTIEEVLKCKSEGKLDSDSPWMHACNLTLFLSSFLSSSPSH
jgi:hypothetical protein